MNTPETMSPDEKKLVTDVIKWCVRRIKADTLLFGEALQTEDWQLAVSSMADVALCTETIRRSLPWHFPVMSGWAHQSEVDADLEAMNMAVNLKNRHDQLGVATSEEGKTFQERAAKLVADLLGREAGKMLDSLDN